MQAIILAAGMGKRLKELTRNNTKCMVEVNGVTLIERMLRQIDSKGLDKIIMVVGYECQKLMDYISTLDINTEIVFVENPVYDKTNNIYSLALAKDYLLADDTLLFESDLIFEDSLIDLLLDDERPTLTLVDKYESWMDGTCVTLCGDDIVSFIPGKQFDYEDIDSYYKTVNIYKFGKEFSETHYVPFLEAYTKALGNNEYYEQVLKVITMLDNPAIKAKRLEGQLWYEIDDIQDLDIASSLFAEDDDERLVMIQSRYGGYWRYPKLVDFCYLVNPYYPPKRMVDEMKSNFEMLLTQYPSGMRVNSLLAARNFGLKPEQIVIGNGAAELIKSLMDRICREGDVMGFIRPTFEEYPNRYDESKQIVFVPQSDDFSYNADDIMEFFGDKQVSCLTLINPDNPTGNYICRSGLTKLIGWAGERNMTLIIDESFVDFAEEENPTLLISSLLAENPHLIVVKSISKSYGVPGIRLGIVASGNSLLIAQLKKDVAIWNINSFGEFYMQISEKYKKHYERSLTELRKERARFVSELSKISGIEVFPSQANYVMIRLGKGISSLWLTKELLIKHSLFIKDLTKKVSSKGHEGEYIRVAVRDTADNDKLIKALKEYFD